MSCSAVPRKSGEHRLLACSRRQPADDTPAVAKTWAANPSRAFRQAAEKEQASSLRSPEAPARKLARFSREFPLTNHCSLVTSHSPARDEAAASGEASAWESVWAYL